MTSWFLTQQLRSRRSPKSLRLARAIEESDGLGALVRAVEQASQVVASPGLEPRLRGEWLGHALHPLLTDLPLGCWFAATVLDLTGHRGPASRRLIGVGLLLVPVTVAAGLAEWRTLRGDDARKVAAVHAAGNALAATAFLLSWNRRRKGKSGRGWSLLGAGLAVFTGYLGGHLSFGKGVGVGARGGGASPLAPILRSIGAAS